MGEEKAVEYPPITAGIINYNGIENGVINTISSLLASDYPAFEVIVADDCSIDGGPELIEEKFPNVKVYRLAENGGPNAVRNLVLEKATNEIVFITDNDIEFAVDTLKLLVETILSNKNVGVATPMVLDSIDRNKIYSNGVELHYTCFAVIPYRHEQASTDLDLSPRRSICGSGGIMMTKKSVAEKLSGFDEDFVFGYDDGEYTYRVSASGLDVIHTPAAKIYHLEKPLRNPKRLRYQVRGRWTLILKTYAARTLILLFPALLFFELVQLLFLTLKGAGGEWLKGIGMVIKDFPRTMAKRRETLVEKRRPDKELLCSGEIFMFPDRAGSSALQFAKSAMEFFLNIWWSLVRPLLSR